MKNNKKYIKTKFIEFLNENDNYVPKQQPYGGFVSHPKSPNKLERSKPFMSTNIVGTNSDEKYTIRYNHGKFTDEMIYKLVKILTNNLECNIDNIGSMYKEITVGGEKIGSVEYDNQFLIYTKYVKKYIDSLKDVFPNEYQEYIQEYS